MNHQTQVFGYLVIKLQDTTRWYKNQNTVQSHIIYLNIIYAHTKFNSKSLHFCDSRVTTLQH